MKVPAGRPGGRASGFPPQRLPGVEAEIRSPCEAAGYGLGLFEEQLLRPALIAARGWR